MAQQFLYIVDHFIPFPNSEYGGVWNVIAEDDNECFDLIVDYDGESYPEHYGKLRENIIKASRYALAEYEEIGVIHSFTT